MPQLLRASVLLLTATFALTACRAVGGDSMAKDQMAKDQMAGDHMAPGAMAGDKMTADKMTSDKVAPESMMKASLTGDFKALHAPTTGSVALAKGADGRWTLTISNLKTEPAPDLHVWLVPAGEVTDSPELRKTRYIDLGTVQTAIASKALLLPAGIDAAAYPNVVLWCDQFSVAFAAAALK